MYFETYDSSQLTWTSFKMKPENTRAFVTIFGDLLSNFDHPLLSFDVFCHLLRNLLHMANHSCFVSLLFILKHVYIFHPFNISQHLHSSDSCASHPAGLLP